MTADAPSTTLAGIPVRQEPEGIRAALSAVAVIKGLNEHGNVDYWVVRTEGVTCVEALGMHDAAAELHRDRIRPRGAA